MKKQRTDIMKGISGNGSAPRALAVLLCCIVLFVFAALRGTALYADFDDLGAGARAIGMGNAFTALADDVFGMYYNPAGLGLVKTGQVGADLGKLYVGLDDGSNLLTGFGAIAIPLQKTQFKEVRITTVTVTAPLPAAAQKPAVLALPGISSTTAQAVTLSTSAAVIGSTASDALPAPAAAASPAVPVLSTTTITVKETSSRQLGTLALGWKYFTLAESYRESAYYLGFGRMVGERWAWGLNVKYLEENYIMDEYLRLSPVFNYGAKNAVQNMSVDAGIIVILAPRVFLGISGSDLNQPNLGLKEQDFLPATGRIGLAWKDQDLSWAVNGTCRSGRWYYSTGFEKELAKFFTIRSGLSLGERDYFNLAAGFSVNFYRTQLDYVFQYPMAGLEDIAGTHRLSFLFRFGRRQKEELEIGSLEYYYEKMEDYLANTQRELVETKTEKENLEKVLIEEATMRIQERIKAAKAEAAAVRSGEAAARQTQKIKNDLRDTYVKEDEVRESREKRHLVKKGETLQMLAERYYGDAKYWNDIYQANRDSIGRGGVLKPNQVLLIPSLSRSDAAAVEAPVVVKEVTPIKLIDTSQKITPIEQKAAVLQPVTSQPVAIKIVPIAVKAEPTAAAVPTPVAAKPAAAAKPVQTAPSQPRAPAGPRRHIVQPGENLRSIAQKYYNDGDRWKDIYRANRDKVVSGQVKSGQEIVIP
jgi:nucleoid-associated protein YgaU